MSRSKITSHEAPQCGIHVAAVRQEGGCPASYGRRQMRLRKRLPWRRNWRLRLLVFNTSLSCQRDGARVVKTQLDRYNGVYQLTTFKTAILLARLDLVGLNCEPRALRNSSQSSSTFDQVQKTRLGRTCRFDDGEVTMK